MALLGGWKIWRDVDVSSWAPSDDADFSAANQQLQAVPGKAAVGGLKQEEITGFVWTCFFLDSDDIPAVPGTADQTFNLRLAEVVEDNVVALGATLELGASPRQVYGPYNMDGSMGAGIWVPVLDTFAGTDPSLPTLRFALRRVS